MGSGPHRDFTWIERAAVPAFSESRAGNRPDLVDEENHDFTAVCPSFQAEVTHPPHLCANAQANPMDRTLWVSDAVSPAIPW
jgi:hypothetical protein